METTTKQPKCKEVWASHKDSRIRDIRKLWKLECAGNEESDPEIGTFNEYGLSFDFVAPDTFGQKDGYWRYQISWGGPSDEFRFYPVRGAVIGEYNNVNLDRVTYCFMDWFDGYNRKLTGKDEALMLEIFYMFCEVGSAYQVYKTATEEE